MKMVKSLLLGSAAGLVAVAGAQAADMPVKAKPVQYVKICSLYGAGFYYIPGTDTCIKVGGWVRQYLGVGANNDLTNGALGSFDLNTRASANAWVWKSRGYITADARTQTEFGTVRGYFDIGESSAGGTTGEGATVASTNRAFIQWAGFTFGITQSFYDLYPTPALSYFGGGINPSSDTGDGGKTVTAYTAQFGSGFSASLSLEAPRSHPIVGPTSAPTSTSPGTSQQAALRYPDVVANLRVDQGWGSAQIMGGIHDASGQYYGATAGAVAGSGPSQATGWALGVGAKVNLPMLGQGDYISSQFNYTVGDSGYANNNSNTAYGMYNGGAGGSYGYGWNVDGVYAAGGSVELTTVWGVNAGLEHYWTPHWQTSLYGAYLKYNFDTTANTTLCAMQGAAGVISATLTVAAGCNNDFSYWDVGTRTQFNIDSQTYIGVDVIYTKLNTASGGFTGTIAGSGTQPTVPRTISDQSAWIAEFRMHRNFYP